MRKRAIAFLLAPLAALLPIIMLLLAWGLTSGYPLRLFTKPDSLGMAVGILILGAGASYVCTWILGMPAHVVLLRLGRTSLQDYVVTGLALTIVPVAIYFGYVVFYEMRAGDLIAPVRRYAADFVTMVIFFGLCGALVASAYWSLNVRPSR